MTRQGKTWLFIGAIFVALLCARGMIGQGLGRVYVKRTQVTVTVPDAAAVNSTAAPTTAANAHSSAAASLSSATSPSNTKTISWQEWKQVAPLEFDAAQKVNAAQTEISLSWPRTIGLWLAAFFTLAIFSFLYADNPFYKIAVSYTHLTLPTID
jgi:hypothetical protein